MNRSSNDNGAFSFLDILNILSFILALQNYDLNVDQNYMQDVQQKFNDQISIVVNEIHTHLQQQDDKIDEILSILKQSKDDSQ